MNWEEAKESARSGKKAFLVREITTVTHKVWAESSEDAKDELYWQQSSGRPFPAVERLNSERRTTVEPA